MKYADYAAKKEALEDKLRPLRPEETKKREPYWNQMHDLITVVERRWKLGWSRDIGYDGPREMWFTYRPDLSLGVEMDLGAPHGLIDARNEMWKRLTGDQWRKIADIVDEIWLWQQGKVDTLPPSGDWRAP